MPSLFDSHRSLIGRAVRVHLVDGSFAVGFLYAIDPETDHVAIVRHCKGAGLAASGPSVASFMDVQVIMGHCVKQVDGDDHSECLDEAEAIAEALGSREMEKPCDSPCTRGRGPQEDVQQLRNKFNAFLDQHLVPYRNVKERDSHSDNHDDSVCRVELFNGVASVEFPFDESALTCANEQILVRLQQLMRMFTTSLARDGANPSTQMASQQA